MRRLRANHSVTTIVAACGVAVLAVPALAGPDLPAAGVLVSHRVDDYDTWKKAFDDHVSARVEAGCLGHRVHRDADDPNLVWVYFPGTSTDRLKEFTESPDLHEAMERAGVHGPPSITFLEPRFSDVGQRDGTAGMIAQHAVEDYESWRAVYDDLDDYRNHAGITGHAVHQVAGDPDRVVVYHRARDLETLREFVASEVLANAMREAGVVGQPDIRLVRVADWAEYPGASIAAHDPGREQ